MADDEHLKILMQGVEAWNEWREKNPEILPNLMRTYLSERDLRRIDLRSANLYHSDLTETNLRSANLTDAELKGANLSEANLIGANLTNASLSQANLSWAQLIDTNLSRADLWFTNLSGTNLQNADFTGASLRDTVFVNMNLSATKGLNLVSHRGPSFISIDTLYKSGGNIPESFLRGCGLSDWEIESAKLYNLDLSNEEINNIQYRIHDLRANRALQINPLFISYSHSDSAFVDEIEKYLIESGIRFWRDKHHATAGRLEKQIDRAIMLNNDVVLLVLSEHSTASDWVEHEARKAREKEKQTGKDALCPVALDDSWKTCRWPQRLREQILEYNILDFSNWQDSNSFQTMFGKLLEGLNLFYK